MYDDIHGRFPDGTWIHTSHIPKFRKSDGEGTLVQTMNSVYLLGKPHEEA